MTPIHPLHYPFSFPINSVRRLFLGEELAKIASLVVAPAKEQDLAIYMHQQNADQNEFCFRGFMRKKFHSDNHAMLNTIGELEKR